MSLTTILNKLFGNKSQRDLKEIQPIVDQINALGPKMKELSNDELRDVITNIKKELQDAVADDTKAIAELKAKIEELPFDERQPLWDDIDAREKNILEIYEKELDRVLPSVFAAMRETAARFAANETVEVTASQMDRDLAAAGKDFVTIEGDKAIYKNHWIAGGNEVTWDMIHYDVQLIGGIVLHQGKIAEMATGEGKTLVATLPVFLRSLTGRGVHVVTVNDYLSKRDSEWMGPLYMFHGQTVDCIDKHQPNSESRRRAYACDITFGILNLVVEPMPVTSLLVPTMNSVSTIFVTIWLCRRKISCSASIITRLSTRLTRCLSTMPVHRSSYQVLCPRARTSYSMTTNIM